jgi:hypothetical protein
MVKCAFIKYSYLRQLIKKPAASKQAFLNKIFKKKFEIKKARGK